MLILHGRSTNVFQTWTQEGNMGKGSTFILVDSSVLPEVFIKVIEVKKILGSGTAKTVNDAVNEVGISRSAYYKYRDYVFPFYETSRGKVITLYIVVEDFSGILARIIKQIALAKGNIVTINQNIPINGLADVTISIETTDMVKDIKELMDEISKIEGVRRQGILARE
jgi:chorismate mutase